ncbi:MAG: multicopper oxidase domain-containing protein [Flavobacteriales bacterium]|nr:multicopper oxidase domain-containing protein [Flavobacteriales bacterium]
MKKYFLTFFCCILFNIGYGATINQILHINSGYYMAVDSSQFPYYSFNESANFQAENKRIIIAPNDSLFLMIINTDSITHGFNIKNYVGVNRTILAGDTAYVSCSFSVSGMHIYYDSYNYPNNRYMGLSGMIVVENSTASKFFWNIKEHQKLWNKFISTGTAVTWQNYYPDYFTINGKSNPHINSDTTARVIGKLGDTIRIYIANTGQSVHSLHFHGYHSSIIYSSKHPIHVGRLKDTFSVYRMESLILELIPDQKGEYPVHDHNLVAVSGGHIYPNGMFLTILIQ